MAQLGGNIVAEETYQSLGGNPASWQNVVTRLNGEDADVIVTSTAAAFGAQVPILNGLRTLGNNTPMLNSWAGDGNYWYTPNPKVDELLLRHVRLGVRRRPGQGRQRTRQAERRRDREGREHRRLRHRARPRSTASSTALGARAARRTALALAAQMEKFKNVTTLSGQVSFSRSLHTVFGRQYRVIRVQNNDAEGRRDGEGEGRSEDLTVVRRAD